MRPLNNNNSSLRCWQLSQTNRWILDIDREVVAFINPLKQCKGWSTLDIFSRHSHARDKFLSGSIGSSYSYFLALRIDDMNDALERRSVLVAHASSSTNENLSALLIPASTLTADV